MIILASASPRRKELLKLIVDDFCIEPADIEESVTENIEIEKYPEYLAVKKAEDIFNNGHGDDVVIGCDTGVFIDGQMLGKPKNAENAKEMLAMLSGKTHKVITGVSVYSKGQCIRFSSITCVEFFELCDKEIEEYVLTGEPMDKAGAYGIQGRGALLVKEIHGDYYNVVGLPVAQLSRVLRRINVL